MAPRLALLLALAGPALAEEAAPPGASACLGCHSPVRQNAAIPSLRGRDPVEIAAMLQAFREGKAPATVMDRLARGFDAAESRTIAAWVVR
ncbi:sulfide dehydrogenase [Siccirubricoccus sp. KC 17139]|uniref:Sulfide dehydrogenase n=1 Tax=Siccirubricoccus soli TaxID=2899147 RepID=A0ABT1CZI0_9PROT|nr:sulfide dehydrogenase [Siccirubricoccus soli]MCO6415054.1 sulfide dehydrogenase [Siccirubricoccus soli]MCP2681185.1 sulfide dehydrogenase [Siccirubricoccus soli]